MRQVSRFVLIVLFGFVSTLAYSQEGPPIQNYTPLAYGAGNQNWSISQDHKDKHIYVANNKGLLEFNGAEWTLYKSPNETIIRSVKAVNDKIYTGCYMEFGYWVRDAFGNLNYTSLSENLKIPLVEDEQFWNILNLDHWVIFQSLNRIYIYNSLDKTYETIDSEFGLTKIYKVDDSIYYQKVNQGIYKFENGKEVLVSNANTFKENIVVNIFKQNGALLFVTQKNGVFSLSENRLSPWNTQAQTTIKNLSVYSCIRLEDKNLALGTVSNGIYILDISSGQITYQIKQDKGLSNNTVLSLFEDMDHNIWLGLDNGINCINFKSPFSIYNDYNGDIGTVYSSIIFNNTLYLGTNQGLFYRQLNTDQGFSLVKGLKGQVWCLTELDNKLFCGHDSGTYIITDNTAAKIANTQGTWHLVSVPNNPNLILQGNYSGLHLLNKIDGQWHYNNKIEGFNTSFRYFEFVGPHDILVNHEYKGVFKVSLNNAFTNVMGIDQINSLKKGLNSSLVKFNGVVYYGDKSGIYKYSESNNTFVKDTTLSKVYNEDNFMTGKLEVDKKANRLWCFTKNSIDYISPGKLSNVPEIQKITIPNSLRKGVSGYENITHINKGEYLLGTSNGYFTIKLNKLAKKEFNISINAISCSEINQDPMALNKTKETELTNKQNNIRFDYSVAEFDKFFKTEYQYQLKGLYNQWSKWSNKHSIYFENLPYGDYTFNVKGRIGNNQSKNIASYSFSIQKPWFLSNLMIAVYILGFVMLSVLIHFLYNQYYKNQREKLLLKTQKELELKELENKQQLMQFKNEKLEQDIKSKNRELAISTMSLIKKNEFLNNLKDQLKAVDSSGNVKPVIKLINKNINNTDDWKFFEEAFNNADKDFLKKIKSIHPNLTPNDLRLCAYLRLNLSSKEIAPLLNISPKSVEVKRYRLRKKMNLPHETSLTNYILEI